MKNDEKDVVVGLGEIGSPILKLLSLNKRVVGYDINKELMNQRQFKKFESLQTCMMHVCIPFTQNFIENIMKLFDEFSPQCVVIHSTIKPNTTKKLQQKLPIPVIYSATRGVHKRMLYDLKRYVKFYALEKDAPRARWASKKYACLMKNCKVKIKKMSSPLTLELAKIICDTSYYGWLIIYSQISKIITMKYDVDFDEMWSFADEIHKYLGNRPKMFPGFIGGHCVIPNLMLIDNELLNIINDFNLKYKKILGLSRLN